MLRRASSETESVWFPLQVLHSNTLKYPHNQLIIWINRMAAASNYGTRFAHAPSCSSSCPAPRTK